MMKNLLLILGALAVGLVAPSRVAGAVEPRLELVSAEVKVGAEFRVQVKDVSKTTSVNWMMPTGVTLLGKEDYGLTAKLKVAKPGSYTIKAGVEKRLLQLQVTTAGGTEAGTELTSLAKGKGAEELAEAKKETPTSLEKKPSVVPEGDIQKSEDTASPRLISSVSEMRPGDVWSLEVEDVPEGVKVAWQWDADLLSVVSGGSPGTRLAVRAKTRSYLEKKSAWVEARVVSLGWKERAEVVVWDPGKGKPMTGADEAPEKPKPPQDIDSGDGPLKGLEPHQREIAELVRQSISSTNPLPPADFYRQLQNICNEYGKAKPMVELNRVKSELNRLKVGDQFLGAPSKGGATLAETRLLEFRRDLTLEGIRHAITEVLRQSGGNAAALGEVYLAKIGKWAGQDPSKFTFAGDIDFTFLAADPAVSRALVQAFDAFIQGKIGMTMAQLDSLSTAHGQAGHLVYVGPQGEKYGDDEMMKLGKTPKDLLEKKSGLELIDFNNPDKSHLVSGREALETVLFESVLREMMEANNGRMPPSAAVDAEFERRWNEKRNKMVEPFLSMEMARHLEGDIIRDADVFSAFDAVKKGSKYLRRSNDIFHNDFDKLKWGGQSQGQADAWEKFARNLDEMAAGKWPEGFKKPVDAGDSPSPRDMGRMIKTFFGTQGELGKMFGLLERGQNVELLADLAAVNKFLGIVQQKIWDNVSKGFDNRIRMLNDLHNEHNEARRKAMVEQTGHQLQELLKMLEAGLDVVNHDQVKLPDTIIPKAKALLKLLETLPSTTRFKFSAEELEKVKKLLEACEGKGEAQRMVLLGMCDKLDKWIIKNAEQFSPKAGETVTAANARAAAYLDSVNAVLDVVDNSTIQSLRDNGIIEFEYMAEGESGKEEKQAIRLITCESVAKINKRLNESVFGRLGNSTAFKAFNMEQEAEAYWNAIVTSKTPGEAFEQLSTEFFRRRVPGGDAVEALVMGQWSLAALKVVYVIFPTTAIPEAIWGLSRTVQGVAVKSWWSSELQLQVDALYAGAAFDQKDPKTQQPTEKWYLTKISSKGTEFERKAILAGEGAFFHRDFDDALWANLAATDPFITLMEELEQHPAAGQKVQDKFRIALEKRWQEVRCSFAKKMVEQFEARKASAKTDETAGKADEIYADLIKITTELDIGTQAHKVMNEKWSSNNLKVKVLEPGLTAWRSFWGQPMPETERSKAITVVREARDAFKKVLDARTQAEAAADQILTDRGVPGWEKTQDKFVRILTGSAILSGDWAADEKKAQAWAVLPASVLRGVEEELTRTKQMVLPGAALEGEFDKKCVAELFRQELWLKVWEGVKVPAISKASYKQGVEQPHRVAAKKVRDDFLAHYGGVSKALVVTVQQKLVEKDPATGKPKSKLLPLPTADLSLKDAKGNPVQGERQNESDFVFASLQPGTYQLLVTAKGFQREGGAAAFQREIIVPTGDKGEKLPKVDVVLVPIKEGKDSDLDVGIEVRDGKGKLLSGSPIALDADAPVTLQAKVTAKSEGSKFRYNWACEGKVLGGEKSDSVTFSGKDKIGRTVEVTLLVMDEAQREGNSSVSFKITAARELTVRLSPVPASVPANKDLTVGVEEPEESEGKLTYQWFQSINGKWADTVIGERRSIQVAPGRLAGEDGVLALRVIVRNEQGRTGKAATGPIRVGADAQSLRVTFDPPSATIEESGQVRLDVQVEKFEDSGELTYYWDESKQGTSESSLVITGADMKAVGQMDRWVVTSVKVVDARGREGEASVSVWCNSKKEKDPEKKPDDTKKTPDDGGKTGEPKGVAEVTLKASPQPAKVGQNISVSATWAREVDLGSCRVVWSHGQGTLYSCSIPAKDGGKFQVRVEYFRKDKSGKEQLAARGTCDVVVTGKPKITAPAELLYGDIFQVSVSPDPVIAPLVTQYYWYGGTLLSPTQEGRSYATTTASVNMQFVPHDRMTSTGADGKPEVRPTTVSVTAADAAGKNLDEASVQITVRPVRFSTTAGGNWKVEQNDKGLYCERKPEVRKRKEGDKELDSATASGNLRVVWERFVPESEAELKKNVEEAAIWRSLPPAGASEGKIEVVPFAVGDYKGFIKRTTTVVTRYNGNPWGYVDVCHPQANTAGWAQVVKGKACLTISYSTGGGGMGLGTGKLWWDDMPFLQARAAAADAEIKAMLGALKLTADPNIKVVPYTPPADTSGEAPKDMKVTVAASTTKPKFAQTVDVTATVVGGKAPYQYEWKGDHAGKGEKVTFVSRIPGTHTLSVKVTDATGSSVSGEVIITVEAGSTAIKGLPAQIVYGQTATISTEIPEAKPGDEAQKSTPSSQGTNKNSAGDSGQPVLPSSTVTDLDGEMYFGRHARWNSTPNLTFDPPQTGPHDSTRVTFSEMGKVKIWATLHEGDGTTFGEAVQAECEVVAPQIALKFAPSSGAKAGEEVKATIETTPTVPEAMLRVVWLEPSTSQKMELNKSGTQISFKAPAAGKPIVFHAELRVPGSGETIGEIKETYSGTNYLVEVKALDPETARPTYWDPVKKEHVSPPRGTFIVDERVRLRAELLGSPKVDEVRWAWTANEGTTLSADGGNENTVSRHESGSAEVKATARDKEGRELGAGLVNVSFVEGDKNPPAAPLSVTLSAEKTTVESGGTVALTAKSTGGTAPVSFAWKGASGSGAAAVFKAEKAGTYPVTVTATDSKGKTAEHTVSITVKPVELKVVLTCATPKPVVGAAVTLAAAVTQGTAPYTMTWSKNVQGQGANAQMKPVKPGPAEVEVIVEDRWGNKGAAKLVIEVAALEIKLTGLAPKEKAGAKKMLTATITGQSVSPAYVILFHAQPELSFSPSESTNGQSTVTLAKAGSMTVWVEAKSKASGEVVGKSAEVKVEVEAASYKLVFNPSTAMVGKEMRVNVQPNDPGSAAPAMDCEYAWSGVVGETKGESAGTLRFVPQDINPLAIEVVVKHRATQAELGRAKGEWKAQPLPVSVRVLGPESSTRPLVWDAVSKSMQPFNGPGYIVGERVKVQATLGGSVGNISPVFEWAGKEDGDTLEPVPNVPAPAGKVAPPKLVGEALLARALDEVGTAGFQVIAKNPTTQGELGRASGSVNFSATKQQVKDGEKQAESNQKQKAAAEKWAGAQSLVAKFNQSSPGEEVNDKLRRLVREDNVERARTLASEAAAMDPAIAGKVVGFDKEIARQIAPWAMNLVQDVDFDTAEAITQKALALDPQCEAAKANANTLKQWRADWEKIQAAVAKGNGLLNELKVGEAEKLIAGELQNLLRSFNRVAPKKDALVKQFHDRAAQVRQQCFGHPAWVNRWPMIFDYINKKNMPSHALPLIDELLGTQGLCDLQIETLKKARQQAGGGSSSDTTGTEKAPTQILVDSSSKPEGANGTAGNGAANGDGTYQGGFSGSASGKIEFTVTGGKVVGKFIGTYEGSRFEGTFQGTCSAQGQMVTTVQGQFVGETQAYPFTGNLNGRLQGGKGAGAWDGQNQYGRPQGSWEASRGGGKATTGGPATNNNGATGGSGVAKDKLPSSVSAYAGEYGGKLVYRVATPSGITDQPVHLRIEPNGNFKTTGKNGSSLMEDILGRVDASGRIQSKPEEGGTRRVFEGQFTSPTSASGRWDYSDGFVGQYGGTWEINRN
jgi:hypothetical protein